VRKIDLEVRATGFIAFYIYLKVEISVKTGKSLSTFKGHTGPVTSLAFCDRQVGSGDQEILISGAWDKV
jgi:WD40 repeat protein